MSNEVGMCAALAFVGVPWPGCFTNKPTPPVGPCVLQKISLVMKCVCWVCVRRV